MDLLQQSAWGALLTAFVGGLLSFFSPCVAPLVPSYLGYLSGNAVLEGQAGAVAVSPAGRLSRTQRVTLLFVAGFSCAFIAVGLLAGSFGSLLVAYRPVMETLAGIVMVVMGAFLLGLLPKQVTSVLMREGRVHLAPGRAERFGWATPFVMGVIFAAGWTPCIGPVLAAIFAYVAAAGSPGVSALLLAVYSLGFAIPFISVGFGLSSGLVALGWVKRHGQAVSITSGVLLVLVGIVYLTGEVNVFATWAQPFTFK